MLSSMDTSSRAKLQDSSYSSSLLAHSSSSPNVRPPRSTAFCAGRSKTEQVVLEFLYKAAELIVQSRVNLQAEPDWRRSSRRARFNLDIEEVPVVRDAMAAWRDDVRLPLAIDIFWEGAVGSCRKVLLERWSVTFAAEGESLSSGLSSTQDVIQQLKEVCKKISVLLRALFSFIRQLPAHRLFVQSYPSMLSYTIDAVPASDTMRAFEAQDVATSGYAFIPIATPFGLLKVATVYRRDCSQFTEQQEQATPSRILQNNFIIQDYVPGSPDLVPASAPAPLWTRAALVESPSPTREADFFAASFVPTSDAQLLRDDDVRDLPRCRSSPRSIPMSIAGSKQHFNSTGVDSKRTKEVAAVCHQLGVSQPMDIPRASIEGSVATADTLNAGTGIEYSEDKSDGTLLQHAHSYGGEQDGRLRGASADSNVTAAPYGYGNVAVEREQQHQCSPSVAFQQRQQQLWEGTNRQDSEIGQRDHQTFVRDEPPTSNSNAGCRPLSTPPRHPQSNLLQQHDSRHRRMSFNGAFVSEVVHAHSSTTFVGLNAKTSDGSPGDGLDMLLPFAIGDGSMTVTSAFDTQSGSSPNCSSRLETAAVGAFLHQLKNAPKLSRSTCAGAGERPGQLSSEGRDDISSRASLFDDELASFRSLRDELARAL